MQSLVHKHNVMIQAWQPHILNVLMLLLRCYVAWVFWQAGYLKFTNWAATEYLFQFEYQVPILPWQVAAVVGTATELIVPIFIAIGLVTRLTGGLLFVFNAVAVMSYPVLYQDGFALFAKGAMDHQIWGLMLLFIVTLGAGRWSFDQRLHIA
jgi:putative oxidoreductase